MTIFENGLRTSLESKPELSRKGRRILYIIHSPNSPWRTWKIKQFESHARAHLGIEGPYDWGLLDWAGVILSLLKLLLFLLPFFAEAEKQHESPPD